MLVRTLAIACAVALSVVLSVTGTARAAEDGTELPRRDWSFDGIFGAFDQAQLKRGYLVYTEVCASCHGISLVAYRNLAALGFTAVEIKKIAAEKEVPGEPDVEGEPKMRKAKPSDRFVQPFANEQAARASNNGSLPPDLSVITKARPGGADYIFALMTGYAEEPPKGSKIKLAEDMYYNRFYPGHQIAMSPPISEDAVEYTDGTKATVENMGADVAAFLTWTAEPELNERKRMGVKVMLFLLFLTALLFAVKRKVWADLH